FSNIRSGGPAAPASLPFWRPRTLTAVDRQGLSGAMFIAYHFVVPAWNALRSFCRGRNRRIGHSSLRKGQSMKTATTSRRLPVGAEVLPDGGVHYRVWAPSRKRIRVVIETDPSARPSRSQGTALEAEPDGYFSGVVRAAKHGTLYRFRLDDE